MTQIDTTDCFIQLNLPHQEKSGDFFMKWKSLLHSTYYIVYYALEWWEEKRWITTILHTIISTILFIVEMKMFGIGTAQYSIFSIFVAAAKTSCKLLKVHCLCTLLLVVF